MQRRMFRREYKLEAVKLIRERGGTVDQAARDLDVHENVLDVLTQVMQGDIEARLASLCPS